MRKGDAMSIKVPNQGENGMLTDMLSILNTYKLHLYKNNLTPGDATVIGDFTEADFAGYAPVTLNAWGAVAQNANAEAETDHPMVTFTCTGPATSNDIYGYYVTNTSGALRWAEKNPNGLQTINAGGQTYPVIPRFVLLSRD